jgi:GNAT superfamily N-acetyltransferase
MVGIDFMQVDDIPRVSQLITDVFNEFEAPEYPPEGIKEFMGYIAEDRMRERLQSSNYFGLVAHADGEIVGVTEVRDWCHISLLFVAPQYHREGIGKALFQRSLEICRQSAMNLTKVTVNSSPYAVPIYEKLGFVRTDEEQLVNGIRFVPMIFYVIT